MPPPGSLPAPCDGKAPESERHRFAVSAGYGLFNTTLRFDDDREFDLAEQTVTVAFRYQPLPRWSFQAAVSTILTGELTGEGVTASLSPGVVAALGGTWRAVAADGAVPFLDLSFTLAAAWAGTEVEGTGESADFIATDGRVGARLGWFLFDHWAPYVAVRAFGGPVFWELADDELMGSDIHHYQLAVGSAVSFDRFGLYVDWGYLGERALAAGLAVRF